MVAVLEKVRTRNIQVPGLERECSDTVLFLDACDLCILLDLPALRTLSRYRSDRMHEAYRTLTSDPCEVPPSPSSHTRYDQALCESEGSDREGIHRSTLLTHQCTRENPEE